MVFNLMANNSHSNIPCSAAGMGVAKWPISPPTSMPRAREQAPAMATLRLRETIPTRSDDDTW